MSVPTKYYDTLEEALATDSIFCNDLRYYSLTDGYLGDYVKPHLRRPNETGPWLLGHYYVPLKRKAAPGKGLPAWATPTTYQALTSQELLEHRRAKPRYIQFRTGISGEKCRHIQYPLSVPVNTADAINKLSLKFNDFFYVVRGLCGNFRLPPLTTSGSNSYLYNVTININTPSLTSAEAHRDTRDTDSCWASNFKYILESLTGTYYTLIEGILGVYNFTLSAKALTTKPRLSKAVSTTLPMEDFIERLLAAMSLQEMALYTSVKFLIIDLDSELDKDITDLYYKVYPSGECPEWLKKYNLVSLRKAFNIMRDGANYHGMEGEAAYNHNYNSHVKYGDILLSVAQALVLCYNIVRSLNTDIYKLFFANTEPGKYISNEVKTNIVPTQHSVNEYLSRFYWGQQVTMIADEKFREKITMVADTHKQFYIPDIAYVLSNPFMLNFIGTKEGLNPVTDSTSPVSTRRLRVMECLYKMDKPDCDRLLMANMLLSNGSMLTNTMHIFDSSFIVHRLDAPIASGLCEAYIATCFSDYKVPEHAKFSIRLLALFAFWYNTNIGSRVLHYTNKIAFNTRVRAIQYDTPAQVDLERGWIKHPTLDDIYSRAVKKLKAREKEAKT